ncbi:phosphatidylserine decarboxylase [Trametes coccinea BRFM310]|uniref:Phosphatidylserine decarboxylase proenzyme 1, mitochondrial n=1 Tax=Trametes coccinea (strain BRFM310) TaxID=1353009 RepID=A0A1Y2IX47_TRAC3|nr:phosphatidylserine decarboxylase [Trametes coccinea BRFM310]
MSMSLLRSSRATLIHRLSRHSSLVPRTTLRRFSQDTRSNSSNGAKPLYRHAERLADAWRNTPTKWYPLPVAAGAFLLIVLQYRRKSATQEVVLDEHGHEVVRLKGPWHVHVIGALPLRNLSRLWGYLNSLELPVWFRPYGFRLYAWIFGCNLDEIDPPDLTQYRSLGEFFYRKLKDGARPIADSVLVSPADGRVLHFGVIKDGKIEQVKGSTYSLDALLGVARPGSPAPTSVEFPDEKMQEVNHKHFAEINGIEYSLHELLGTPSPASSGASTPATEEPPAAAHADPAAALTGTPARKHGEQVDASVPRDQSLPEAVAQDVGMASEVGIRPSAVRRDSFTSVRTKDGNDTFFMVIYLAPGDYHRFHSPASWVVERRRHFVGDLFSVSPWMAKRLPNLFVLNERVALLGRWRYGFFSMVPVGATNVGSIKINFDQALRTNVGSRREHPVGTYTEAVYSSASPLLNGQPLTKGDEMGGFCLGSTIVLVFEAPHDFKFDVAAGEKVKVGQKLGDLAPEKSAP